MKKKHTRGDHSKPNSQQLHIKLVTHKQRSETKSSDFKSNSPKHGRKQPRGYRFVSKVLPSEVEKKKKLSAEMS